MGKHEKLYQHILMRQSDANVSFVGPCDLLERLGFEKRVKGDHHIFTSQVVIITVYVPKPPKFIAPWKRGKSHG